MTEMQLPKDHPAILAFERYKASDEFHNTFRWATYAEHRTGSMWAAFYEGFQAALSASPPMTDSAETMRKVIDLALAFQDTRAPKYRAPETETARMLMPEGWPTYADLRAIKAALSGTKSDGGVEGHATARPSTSPAVILPADDRGTAREAPMTRRLGDEPGKSRKDGAGIKPGPSDPIPSQPDERERIQQIIELAMIEEAEIQYADFADRDRQREKIITSAAAAILAMQAERQGDNTIQRDKIYRAAERSNTRFGQWIPERWVNIFVEEMSK